MMGLPLRLWCAFRFRRIFGVIHEDSGGRWVVTVGVTRSGDHVVLEQVRAQGQRRCNAR